MVNRLGAVKRRLDIVALAAVVGTAHNLLEAAVGVGLVNGLGDLVEGGLVDHGADKVLVHLGVANLDAAQLLLDLAEELVGLAGGEVDARARRALLARVLKGCANRVLDGVANVG